MGGRKKNTSQIQKQSSSDILNEADIYDDKKNLSRIDPANL